MAFQKLGNGLWIPMMPRLSSALAAAGGTALTATGHKTVIVGSFRHKDGVGKTIVSANLWFGTVSKGGGSGLKFSQQGVSTSAGNPYQNDGVEAQSWAISNGSIPATGGNLSLSDNAGVAVAYGERLAFVLEYDASGRLSTDSVQLRGLASPDNGVFGTAGMVHYNGSAYSAVAVIPSLPLKCSDGTYGTLEGCYACSAISTLALGSESSADEMGLQFTVTGPVKIDGVWAAMSLSVGGDFQFVLYEGTTQIAATGTIDGDQRRGSAGFVVEPFSPVEITAGNTYRLMVKPTTSTTTGIYFGDVALAAHRQCLPGFGEAGTYCQRADGGAFSDPQSGTRIPLMGVRVSHISDGVGGGVPLIGGGLVR